MKKKQKQTRAQILERQRIKREIIVFTVLCLIMCYLSATVGRIYFGADVTKEYHIVEVANAMTIAEGRGNTQTLPAADEYTPETTQEKIQYFGNDAGLEQWEIDRLSAIAMCESKHNPMAQNSVSSAAGVFQIIRATWGEFSEYPFDTHRYNTDENIKTAIKIYKARGFTPWECNNLI